MIPKIKQNIRILEVELLIESSPYSGSRSRGRHGLDFFVCLQNAPGLYTALVSSDSVHVSATSGMRRGRERGTCGSRSEEDSPSPRGGLAVHCAGGSSPRRQCRIVPILGGNL